MPCCAAVPLGIIVVPGDSDLELCRTQIERLQEVSLCVGSGHDWMLRIEGLREGISRPPRPAHTSTQAPASGSRSRFTFATWWRQDPKLEACCSLLSGSFFLSVALLTLFSRTRVSVAQKNYGAVEKASTHSIGAYHSLRVWGGLSSVPLFTVLCSFSTLQAVFPGTALPSPGAWIRVVLPPALLICKY